MLSKKAFIQAFMDEVYPYVPTNDVPAMREAWNDTIDSYIKQGLLPESAGDWSKPAIIFT